MMFSTLLLLHQLFIILWEELKLIPMPKLLVLTDNQFKDFMPPEKYVEESMEVTDLEETLY
jgi:hypothetical protein